MHCAPLVLIVLLVGLRASPVSAQQSDLYLSLTQSAVDKVLADTRYPVTVIDEWHEFSETAQADYTRTYTSGERDSSPQSSERGDPCAQNGSSAQCAIAQDKKNFEAALGRVDQMRDEAARQNLEWQGPTAGETANLRARGPELKAHLRHIKIDVMRRPSMSVNAPTSSISNLFVEVDAIAQVWSSAPDVTCTKHCKGVCCSVALTWRWHRIFEVPVSHAKVRAAASATAIVDKLMVYLEPRLDELRLDYPILRDLPLEKILNPSLKSKHVPVFDGNKLVALLPYLNTVYKIRSLTISGTGEIRADVIVERIR